MDVIIYTCPKCDGDLIHEMLTTYPPINKTYCPKCGWEHTEQPNVVKIPYDNTRQN